MAQSTDYDRTKMSALLALAGLFKPAPSQIWDEEVTWLPIPYSYLKDSFDYVSTLLWYALIKKYLYHVF